MSNEAGKEFMDRIAAVTRQIKIEDKALRVTLTSHMGRLGELLAARHMLQAALDVIGTPAKAKRSAPKANASKTNASKTSASKTTVAVATAKPKRVRNRKSSAVLDAAAPAMTKPASKAVAKAHTKSAPKATPKAAPKPAILVPVAKMPASPAAKPTALPAKTNGIPVLADGKSAGVSVKRPLRDDAEAVLKQIMTVLASSPEPMKSSDIAAKLGVEPRGMGPRLLRLSKARKVVNVAGGRWARVPAPAAGAPAAGATAAS